MVADVASMSVTVPLGDTETFRLFTDRVGDWYRIDQHTVPHPKSTTSLMFEPHVGGRFTAITNAVTGAGDVLGEVEVWEPPARLAFRDLHGCRVDVRFTSSGSTTTVEVRVSGIARLDSKHARQVHRYGWHTVLNWFYLTITGRT